VVDWDEAWRHVESQQIKKTIPINISIPISIKRSKKPLTQHSLTKTVINKCNICPFALVATWALLKNDKNVCLSIEPEVFVRSVRSSNTF